MAITSTDIAVNLSVKTGSAGNTAAGTAANSLGKYVSTTVMPAGANGLFDNISGDENAASATDYRCVFVVNNHASLTLLGAKIWIAGEIAGGANIAIATDNIGPVAKGSTAAQAAEIANETTAPSGVSAFTAPTTKAAGLTLGDLGPGQVKAVWVKRSATNSAALNADGVTFSISGDTAA